MRHISHWLVVAAFALLTGCANTPTVHTDYDRSADFSHYRSFGFMPTEGFQARFGYNSLITQHLKEAVQQEMTARGYQYREFAPDLLVNFTTRAQEKVESSPAPIAAAPLLRRPFYGPWPGYAGRANFNEYTEGRLAIDLVDRIRRQMVWEGVAVGEVTEQAKDKPEENLDKVVADIFAKYPFRAGGL